MPAKLGSRSTRFRDLARCAATLRDVAALAGVSVSTVPNMARGRGIVREETRQRVQDAVDELGYRPNLARAAAAIGTLPSAGARPAERHGPVLPRIRRLRAARGPGDVRAHH
ncbi:hypothetical protein GCM10009579_03640 [Streptomyces javensis]|uniref:HTH lacI-type domain-containing protein n=1 Tax=Streptomyces javensis TaxID=114698 RepID=A0ABN1WGM1_9ACTN